MYAKGKKVDLMENYLGNLPNFEHFPEWDPILLQQLQVLPTVNP